jgi:NAD(P)-dependent dehydrogenase (short-subunit alcohol dehydrogenase family)
MKFKGNVSVVTGGGDGMGRELTKLLVSYGCSVAICDVNVSNMNITKKEAMAFAPEGVEVTTFKCDVSKEDQLLAFAKDVEKQHNLNNRGLLLFNNAGIGGGGSIIADSRKDWEKTFNICWYGVYYSVRAFMPLLLKATSGYVVNTSSVNGFWASIGFLRPHTAYSAAKFAVKGFTEALINDFRLHAPHLKAAIVMPGHVGTGIVGNSSQDENAVKRQVNTSKLKANAKLVSQRVAELKASHDPQYKLLSKDVQLKFAYENGGKMMEKLTDAQVIQMMQQRHDDFRNKAATSATEAAHIILNGVRNDEWRILVGEDAKSLDETIRANPLIAYNANFALKGGSKHQKQQRKKSNKKTIKSKI